MCIQCCLGFLLAVGHLPVCKYKYVPTVFFFLHQTHYLNYLLHSEKCIQQNIYILTYIRIYNIRKEYVTKEMHMVSKDACLVLKDIFF